MKWLKLWMQLHAATQSMWWKLIGFKNKRSCQQGEQQTDTRYIQPQTASLIKEKHRERERDKGGVRERRQKEHNFTVVERKEEERGTAELREALVLLTATEAILKGPGRKENKDSLTVCCWDHLQLMEALRTPVTSRPIFLPSLWMLWPKGRGHDTSVTTNHTQRHTPAKKRNKKLALHTTTCQRETREASLLWWQGESSKKARLGVSGSSCICS